MLYFEQNMDCSAQRFGAFGVAPEQVLFFDIETTGFSPDSSYVYLIGCAFLHNGVPTLRQWFLDDLSEEKRLVREFGAFAADFTMLVHYNGTTFDIPYLQKKAHRLRLPGAYFYLSESREPDESSRSGAGDNQRSKNAASGTDKASLSVSSPPHGKEKPQQSFDIYKKLLPHKKLLRLKDLKQKTVEQFLNLKREDVFSGGDLIPVYTEFIGRYRYECLTRGNPFQKTGAAPSDTVPDFEDTGLTRMPESPAKALLSVLLLHNREDITGLLAITDLLAVTELLAGNFFITPLSETAAAMPFSSGSNEKTALSPPPCRLFRLDTKIPARLLSRCFTDELARELPLCAGGAPSAANTSSRKAPPCITLSVLPAFSDTAELSEAPDAFGSLLLSVPLFSGTLKYFFADYREYYYLPFEDCAIHKSVAQFVDKEYRKKATKDTCYQKKSGLFLPQPTELITPAFRPQAKAAFTYFENTNAALSDPETLKKWGCSLLKWLFDKMS